MSRLKKYIGCFCLALGLGLMSFDSVSVLSDERVGDVVKIQVERTDVRVLNASQLKLEVYDLTGKCVASYAIDSADKTIALSKLRGCYILKVGNITRKISIH